MYKWTIKKKSHHIKSFHSICLQMDRASNQLIIQMSVK